MWTRSILLSSLSFSSSALRTGAPEASVVKLGYTVHYDPEMPNVAFWRDNFADYEPLTYNIFNRFIDNRTVVLDVGAWVGLTALWEGHAARKVFAMEPTASAFYELKRNLQKNPEIAGRVEIINEALGAADEVREMTNGDHAQDQILGAGTVPGAAQWDSGKVQVKVSSIDGLRTEHPELESTGFVKIDTEGYERVIVPALERFLREKKPVTFVSLHEFIAGHEAINATVDKLGEIFPYLYESDMVTPFNVTRAAFLGGDHNGVDVLCTWERL
jgi:FkbM family methyltransferase